jgi:hypothetical protein
MTGVVTNGEALATDRLVPERVSMAPRISRTEQVQIRFLMAFTKEEILTAQVPFSINPDDGTRKLALNGIRIYADLYQRKRGLPEYGFCQMSWDEIPTYRWALMLPDTTRVLDTYEQMGPYITWDASGIPSITLLAVERNLKFTIV